MVSEAAAGKGKVGYLSGPVDARRVYDAWKSGGHTDLFGTSYLTHWFEEVERQGRGGVLDVAEHDYAEGCIDPVIIDRQRGEFALAELDVG